MRNPLLALGCAAVGYHAWTRTYTNWQGQEERQCRWCDKKETRNPR